MHTPLITHINKFTPLTQADADIIESLVTHKNVGKKEYLFREGQVCPANYFVVSGCLRMYYINNKSIDDIVQFGIDNWWLTDYSSFASRTPSHFSIQATEATSLISIDHSVQEDLLARVPAMERYFRIMAQKALGAYQFRIKYMNELSGEERYHNFADSFPGFVQRIPQYMLASYLGFTPEFLSKIRAKKSTVRPDFLK